MKIYRIIPILLCAVMMTGCSDIGNKVSSMLEQDSNIGMNKPAVGMSAEELEALNEAAQSAAKEEEEKQQAIIEEEKKNKELEDKINGILSGMTYEEKIGQLLLARMPSDAEAQMAEYQLGGYTLYGDDFKNSSVEEISALTDTIKAAAKTAPFIAVDEEGGSVIRVSLYSQFREEPFSSPQLLYQRGGTELLEIDGEEKARLLLSLGINFNLAPVADISTNKESYIYPRTIGQNAEDTSAAIAAIVSTANSNNLASCLKHFPGYGENTDTHQDEAHDSRELYEFYNRDFLPFKAGINADEDKTPAVMVGHTVYDSIEEGVPASLSPVIHKALRDKLDFDGVVITDDMGMDALKKYSGENSVYVQAVLAGNDMLCISDHKTAYNDILSAYNEGIITDEMLDAAVTRIIIMKIQYGIIK